MVSHGGDFDGDVVDTSSPDMWDVVYVFDAREIIISTNVGTSPFDVL